MNRRDRRGIDLASRLKDHWTDLARGNQSSILLFPVQWEDELRYCRDLETVSLHMLLKSVSKACLKEGGWEENRADKDSRLMFVPWVCALVLHQQDRSPQLVYWSELITRRVKSGVRWLKRWRSRRSARVDGGGLSTMNPCALLDSLTWQRRPEEDSTWVKIW